MAEKNKVVAKVGEREIKVSDVIMLRNLLGREGQNFEDEVGFQRLRDELINQELLYLDALNLKMDENEDFVKSLEETKRQMLQQYALRKLLGEVDVTDEEVKQYYESHKDKIKSSYTFNADHILVDSEDEAKEIYDKIKAGKDFTEAAKAYSNCPSSENGGNLGDFRSGQMVKEFENSLIDMNEGDITGPVKTQFGYHVIRLNNKTLLRDNSFENVKEELKQDCSVLKQQEHYVKYLNDLETKYPVERIDN